MELWNLYDENRELLNKQHVRGVPIPSGEYHIVIDVWTLTKDGMILLTQRHPDKPHGLLWECTGGSILAGEDSIAGAIRELSEEVGIKVTTEELILIYRARLSDRFVDTYITIQDIHREELKLQPEEVVDAKLVTFAELIAMWEDDIVVPKKRFELYCSEIEKYVKELSNHH